MKAAGLTGAELRVIDAKNIMDLEYGDLERVRELVRGAGFETVSIASPLLKCVLPNAAALDTRFEHDIFASKHTYEDQDRLAQRAFAIAQMMGAKIVRVFSYWRTVEPEKTYDAIVAALQKLGDEAGKRGLTIGLENEHACNIATGAEAAQIIARVNHPSVKLVWDPANAYVSGEDSFPEGYRKLPRGSIAHVHAKDCRMKDGSTPEWGAVGTMGIDWKGQIAALLADGYAGWISLETHWTGPRGNKMEASSICAKNLHALLAD
ncbi:MAG TPA: sugar phosphate isomerase/epimerase family protein [Bryobacteraceae bacterium]|nr:sugar phosphate isomerase/epimerase family protein [Bryobacteraceae bacterium]